MTKSSQHQASVKYFLKPYALILMIISQTKITVNTLSMYFKIILSIFRCGRLTSSMAWPAASSINEQVNNASFIRRRRNYNVACKGGYNVITF